MVLYEGEIPLKKEVKYQRPNLTSLYPEEKLISAKCQSRFLRDVFIDSLK